MVMPKWRVPFQIESEAVLEIIDQYHKALLSMGILNWNSDTNGEVKFLAEYLSPLTEPIVFDVGANVGNYSESVKKICNTAQVYAFEPHPTTFNTLKQSSLIYDYKAINCGLGNENGNVMLYDYKNDDGSEHASLFKNVIEQIHGGESKAHEISIKKLDDLVLELNIDKIHLLKIDTEGNELSVLMGGEKSIRKGIIDVIHFEFNEMNVISRTFFKDFYDFLPEYYFYRLMPEGFFHINAYTPKLCEIFAYQNIVCVKKQKLTQNGGHSDLDKIIPPEIKNDEFYRLITRLAQDEMLSTVLEIGSSAGGGSTEAFVKGLENNVNKPHLYCMEVSLPRYEALKNRYLPYSFVHCYNVSSVPLASFPTEKEISLFYNYIPTNLNLYPLEQVRGWYRQDINYITTSGVPENGIQLIKHANNISTFDMVLIDGSEFAGKAELDEIYGARWILMDDVNSFKNYENYQRLKNDPSYHLIAENWSLRSGYAAFQLSA